MAEHTTVMGLPDGIAQLTPLELQAWDSYQRFLACIDPIAVPVGSNLALIAATLAQATAMLTKPVTAQESEQTEHVTLVER